MVKKSFQKIVKNYKYILFVVLFLMINILFLCGLHTNRFFSNKVYILLIVVLINIIFIGGYSLLFHKKEKLQLEKLYLILIIPIGLLYLLLFPVNTIPDENTHLARISEISSGYLISKIDSKQKIQGRYMDSSYFVLLHSNDYKKAYKNLTVKNSKKKSFYNFSNTALYSFVCYVPQSIGFLCAKILHLPILIQIYMARLFNFLVFVFLTYLALKFMPIKKSVFFMILLFPIVIQEAVSLSPDALTIATTSFLIAYTFHLKCSKDNKITKKELGIIGVTSIILSLCKIVYLPICCIILLIPKEKFKSLKQKNMTIFLIIGLSIFVNFIWLFLSSKFLPKMSGINSAEQLKYIFLHIPQYLMTVFRTYHIMGREWLLNSVGSNLGNFEIKISDLYVIPTIFLFVITILYDNDSSSCKITIKTIEKVWIGILSFGVIALISTSLYLQWTPVGSSMISGIQGRYFIPIYFLLPFLFTKYKISPKKEFLNKYVYLYFVTFNIYVLSTIFYKFI